LMTIAVSRGDFPDTREVAAIEGDLDQWRGKLVVQDEREAGTCEVKLTVGAVEIGVKRSWADMKDMLERLSSEDANL
jgi:hypothetical protein